MTQPTPHEQGFSLLELLVALSIAAIIALLCAQTSKLMIRQHSQWTAQQQQAQQIQNTRQMLADDIRNLSYPTPDGQQTAIVLEHGVLQLHRSHWPEQLIAPHSSSIIVVDYRLEDGCLMRSYHHPHDHSPSPDLDADKHSQICLLNALQSLHISMVDAQGHAHQSWPSRNAAGHQARLMVIDAKGDHTHLRQQLNIDLGQHYDSHSSTAKG